MLNSSREWQAARRVAIAASSQDSGKNSRQFSGQLARSLQQQPAQVALPAGALIAAWQRREAVVGEGFQASTDGGQLGWCEAAHSLLPCAWTGRTSHTPYPSTQT